MMESRENRCTIIKYVTILAIAISAMLFLPELLFSQDVITSYAFGQQWVSKPYNSTNLASFPTNTQLDRLTHIIASDIGCNANGSLYTGKLPNIWNGNKNLWLVSLISRAHAKEVKVSSNINLIYKH